MRVVAEVDVELGLTRVVWIGTAQDVGQAINPQAVDGQIEGGTAQGLGLALMEEIQTRDGLITNASFTDYLIPTTLDMPPVTAELIEEPEPDAPYGVKGVGEPPTVVSTAAIVSALRDATGRELDRVPVRPDDICLVKRPRPSAWHCGRSPNGTYVAGALDVRPAHTGHDDLLLSDASWYLAAEATALSGRASGPAPAASSAMPEEPDGPDRRSILPEQAVLVDRRSHHQVAGDDEADRRRHADSRGRERDAERR